MKYLEQRLRQGEAQRSKTAILLLMTPSRSLSLSLSLSPPKNYQDTHILGLAMKMGFDEEDYGSLAMKIKFGDCVISPPDP